MFGMSTRERIFPQYALEHVKLAVTFVLDSQTLFQREISGEGLTQEGGFGGYMRVDGSNVGITSPLTHRYMRRRFRELGEISRVCDTIENKFKEYDADFWGHLEEDCIYPHIKDIVRYRVEKSYLARFLPAWDITSILLRP